MRGMPSFSLSSKQRYLIQDCIFGASSHSQPKLGSLPSVDSSCFLKKNICWRSFCCLSLAQQILYLPRLFQTSVQLPLQSEMDQTSVYRFIKEQPYYQVIKQVQRRKEKEQREQYTQTLLLRLITKGQRQTKNQGHVSAVQWLQHPAHTEKQELSLNQEKGDHRFNSLKNLFLYL